MPSDIDLSRTQSDGIRMLRDYLAYAMNGEATLAGAGYALRPDDLVDSVARFLRDAGYRVSEHVGCCGYRIDLAVEDPDEDGRVKEYIAGIACDGFSYASARTTRDRDRLRGEVLTGMGWKLYRIWAPAWIQSPETEGDRLLKFIRDAMEDAAARRAHPEALQMEPGIQAARAAQEIKETDAIQAAQQAAGGEKTTQTTGKTEDLSWVHKNAKVYHRKFGTGLIIAMSATQLTVRFPLVDRHFAYPTAFEKGELTRSAQQDTACAADPGAAAETATVQVGTKVDHMVYGAGTLVALQGAYADIRFEDGVQRMQLQEAFDSGSLILVKEEGAEKAGQATQKAQESSEAMLEDMKSAGLTCIDCRNTSLSVWVIYDPDKVEAFEAVAAKYAAPYRLELQGNTVTRNIPAWRVTVSDRPKPETPVSRTHERDLNPVFDEDLLEPFWADGDSESL